MAKPNYSFAKRQRELEKKNKKEEKRKNKAEAKGDSAEGVAQESASEFSAGGESATDQSLVGKV